MKSDTQTGNAKMAAAKDLYPAALANCPKVNAKIGEWGQKFEDLRARPDWDEISKKIYEENKDEIDFDVVMEFKNWNTGKYFDAGESAAKIEAFFLDNAPKQTDDNEQFMFLIPF